MSDRWKDFVYHKLSVRVVYILAAFGTSHLVALLSTNQVQQFFTSAGFAVTILDPARLQAWIVAGLLVVGEVLFHHGEKAVAVYKARVADTPPTKEAA